MSYLSFAKAARLPVGLTLRLNKLIWRRLPSRMCNSYPVLSYGAWLHTLVCRRANREMYLGTFFLRNRPMLNLIRRLCEEQAEAATLRIAVLGCSIGAEVYSILWTIRSARPDLKVVLHAVDISKEVLQFAEKGVYGPNASPFLRSPMSIFERLTEHEKREIFDWNGDEATVKSWLKEGIIWKLGDVADPQVTDAIGLQDIVVASNFLCHLAPVDAGKCLHNIAHLIRPGGHIFVSGVDLNVRTKVALDLGWEPMSELIADIHDGDPSVRADWPFEWWGLEPLDQRRPDWQIRYAAAFQVN